MDTDAVKHLEGNVSNDDIMGIEKTYCKHSNAAKKICGEHHLTMTQCNKKLDVRRKSKIYSFFKFLNEQEYLQQSKVGKQIITITITINKMKFKKE